MIRCEACDEYYVWLDAGARPSSKASRYEHATERMAAERQPPCTVAMLHAGTRQQLIQCHGLRAQGFSDWRLVGRVRRGRRRPR